MGQIDFAPSLVKIKGANRNIDQLRSMTSPLDRSLYEIVMEKTRGPIIYLNPPTYYQLTYRPKEPIPETLANIIGYAFGDLRSALDYIAQRIIRSNIPDFDPKKMIYFPAAPRKDLPAHSGLAPIEQALPGFKKLLLEEIRPENGPNEHLWSFTELNNDDKHNDFVPIVTVIAINNVNAQIGGIRLQNCNIRSDATCPINIGRAPTPITMENDFQTAVEVKFGKGTAFENEPVIPTLLQVCEVVSETLNAIKRLVNTGS
jgi:hypothetical protein